MRKFGFKTYSTNLQTTPSIIREYANFAHSNHDIFMEMTAIPETSAENWKTIKSQIGDMEVRIHTSCAGLNTGNRDFESQNKRILAVAQKAADMFQSQTIVVHPGYGHNPQNLEETARQFKNFNDSRIVVENLPYFDNNGDHLHGSTAREIEYIMNESGCGFCFDFSHAICTALSLNLNIETLLAELFSLKPTVYHLCDGDKTVAQDVHWHFGEGNYPLKHFLHDLTDECANITMETGTGDEPNGRLRIKDYYYLKSL